MDPKFVVSMTHVPAALIPENDKTRARPMTDRTGQRYSCVMPEPRPRPPAAAPAPGTTPASLLDDPSDILLPLIGTCIYRIDGWWTYELCPRVHLRQFHREKGAKVDSASFLLGVWTVDSTNTTEPSANPAIGTTLVQTYLEGGHCDLTGGPRRATVSCGHSSRHPSCGPSGTLCWRFFCRGQVRYMCNPQQGKSLLMDVREPATCQYEATVTTSLLCGHPEFAPKVRGSCSSLWGADGELSTLCRVVPTVRAGPGGQQCCLLP